MWSAGIKQQARGDSAQRPLGLQMSSKVQRSRPGFTIVELLSRVVYLSEVAHLADPATETIFRAADISVERFVAISEQEPVS